MQQRPKQLDVCQTPADSCNSTHTNCWQTFTEESKNRNALTSPAPLNLSQMMSVAL